MKSCNDGFRDQSLRRSRCVRIREPTDAVDLVTGDRPGAALHLDRTKVDIVDVVPKLAESLGAARDLVAARDVGRREARRDVGRVTDHRVLHATHRTEEARDDVPGVDAKAERTIGPAPGARGFDTLMPL